MKKKRESEVLKWNEVNLFAELDGREQSKSMNANGMKAKSGWAKEANNSTTINCGMTLGQQLIGLLVCLWLGWRGERINQQRKGIDWCCCCAN